MKDVMLDFETLGNGTNKCLCQVGACYFDPASGEIGATFKANIDASSHERYGGRLDASTVYWWLTQALTARESILAEPRRDVKEVMTELNQFLSSATRIWSHATFDFVTLQETLKQLQIHPTFKYRSGLDLRTLTNLAGVSVTEFTREGTHHDALDDCRHQVKYASAAIQAIKGHKSMITVLSKFLKQEDK